MRKIYKEYSSNTFVRGFLYVDAPPTVINTVISLSISFIIFINFVVNCSYNLLLKPSFVINLL